MIDIINDYGGPLQERMDYIDKLNPRLEVRVNGKCYSSCTLFLGHDNTCVFSKALLGFHSPEIATRGLMMLPEDFETWSLKMAKYYPTSLQPWWLATARYSKEMLVIVGKDLERFGVKLCD